MLERFEKEGNIEYFEDFDVLCMLLEVAGCQGDRFRISSELITHFGSLKGVLEARKEQLEKIKGVGRRTILVLQSVIPIIRRWSLISMRDPQKIGNIREAELFCKGLLSGSRVEVFYVVCLNVQCKVLGKRKISEGSLMEVNGYPRMVVETALNYNAHSVILCHNHPGGTPNPSVEDIQATKSIQKILTGIGIRVLDHILVYGDDTYSMIEHGDFSYALNGEEA